ncbi:RNA recognition motif-containing protein, partial [Elasticomyces elasticus]
ETWQKAQEEEKAQVTRSGPNGEVTEESTKEEEDEDEEGSTDDNGVPLKDGSDVSDKEMDDVDEADADDDDQASLDENDIEDLAEASPDEDHEMSTGKFNTQNTTVFIRNLPYDTTDDDLHEHFTTNFGGIRYARIVFDHETERPRGTAFVCFRSETDAKNCVKNCPKQDPSTTPFSKTGPSILQNTSTDPTGKYTLSTRVLNITRAIPKGEADRRADDGLNIRKEKAQHDKRRLYLLSEGTVSTGSALHSSLSSTDLAVRQQSQRQRQKLVKQNPNLGLSLTRLSLRNLPRFVDSKALKSLAREAIVGFATDVKEGKRQPISKDELARDGLAGQDAEKTRKASGKGVVRQAKIVYESELNGGKVAEGKGGRSRGYGFVEYWGHRAALMALRWLNGRSVKREDVEGAASSKGENADDDGEKGKRLIVEFAIENAQVVQRRGEREKRDKVWRDRRAEAAENGEVLEAKPRREFQHKSQMDRKRKRDDRDEKPNNRDMGRDRKGKPVNDKKDQKTTKKVPLTDAQQDDKNKLAARNRIISQKRQKRRNK